MTFYFIFNFITFVIMCVFAGVSMWESEGNLEEPGFPFCYVSPEGRTRSPAPAQSAFVCRGISSALI